jgi:hypothetical protein
MPDVACHRFSQRMLLDLDTLASFVGAAGEPLLRCFPILTEKATIWGGFLFIF